MATKKTKLNNPIIVKNEEIKEIELDFSKLKGFDLIQAEKEARADGDMTPLVALSLRYQAAIAARLIGVPSDDVTNMNATDFSKITTQVANFLMGQA